MSLDLAAAVATAKSAAFQDRIQMAMVAVATTQAPKTAPSDQPVKEMALRILRDPSVFVVSAAWVLASLGLTVDSPDAVIQNAVVSTLTQIS